MPVQWNPFYEGIWIDDAAGAEGALAIGEAHAFVMATRRALDKINSRANGRNLLDLISKRCRGVGTRLVGGTVTIRYGRGTLWAGEIRPLTAAHGTAMRDITTVAGTDLRTNTPVRIRTSGGTVVNPNITRAGAGNSAEISYNPFISYSSTTAIGVETPAFVALAHELCHAYHSLSGNAKAYPMPEEAWTVGAGRFSHTEISENGIRKDHGIALRRFYNHAGDCG